MCFITFPICDLDPFVAGRFFLGQRWGWRLAPARYMAWGFCDADIAAVSRFIIHAGTEPRAGPGLRTGPESFQAQRPNRPALRTDRQTGSGVRHGRVRSSE